MEPWSIQHSCRSTVGSMKSGKLFRFFVSFFVCFARYYEVKYLMVLINPSWSSRAMTPTLLSILVARPELITNKPRLFVDPSSRCPMLAMYDIPTLVIWIVSRKNCRLQFLNKQPILLQHRKGRVLWEITDWPGKKCTSWCHRCKIDSFHAL